jgi:MuDR family transposase
VNSNICKSSDDDDVESSVRLVGECYSYDKGQHSIEIGAQYPHVIAFRRALSHHAITKDFEFAIEKSDPTRVTARCKKRDCSWRVHASVTEDGITFEVKTLQPKHSCNLKRNLANMQPKVG